MMVLSGEAYWYWYHLQLTCYIHHWHDGRRRLRPGWCHTHCRLHTVLRLSRRGTWPLLNRFPNHWNTNGGFLKWWYPQTVGYEGKSHLEMDYLGVPPLQETFKSCLMISLQICLGWMMSTTLDFGWISLMKWLFNMIFPRHGCNPGWQVQLLGEFTKTLQREPQRWADLVALNMWQGQAILSRELD